MDNLQAEIIVLSKKEQGENFWFIVGLSEKEGKVAFLARKPGVKSKAVTPDLFDLAEVALSSKGNTDLFFLKDYRLIERGNGLAGNYKCFQWAMRFALIIANNAIHLSHPEEIFSLLRKSIQAWINGRLGEVVFIKSLYLYAKVEGFPIREDWCASLIGSRRKLTLKLLHEPLSQLGDNTLYLEIAESIEQWLVRECDFIIPSGSFVK